MLSIKVDFVGIFAFTVVLVPILCSANIQQGSNVASTGADSPHEGGTVAIGSSSADEESSSGSGTAFDPQVMSMPLPINPSIGTPEHQSLSDIQTGDTVITGIDDDIEERNGASSPYPPMLELVSDTMDEEDTTNQETKTTWTAEYDDNIYESTTPSIWNFMGPTRKLPTDNGQIGNTNTEEESTHDAGADDKDDGDDITTRRYRKPKPTNTNSEGQNNGHSLRSIQSGLTYPPKTKTASTPRPRPTILNQDGPLNRAGPLHNRVIPGNGNTQNIDTRLNLPTIPNRSSRDQTADNGFPDMSEMARGSNPIQNMGRRLVNMANRYPPLQRMFQSESEFVTGLSRRKSELLQKLQRCKVKGRPAFNMSRVSENDAMRILDDLQDTDDHITEKLTLEGGLSNLSEEEIHRMPASFIATLTDGKMTELKSLQEKKLDTLCDKLTGGGACPWNLWTAVKSGLKCVESSIGRRSESDTTKMKKIGYSVSKMMMSYVRETQLPDSWNVTTFVEMSRSLKDSLTVEDINRVPENIVRNSIRNISSVRFPHKSQVRAIVNRASAIFKTPTSWPEHFVSDIGPLFNNIDVDQVALIRNDGLYNLAEDLTNSGITNELTRLVMAEGIHQTKKTKTNHQDIGKMMPWLKGERDFTKQLDADLVITALESMDTSHIHFTDEERFILADKIEDVMMNVDYDNETENQIEAVGAIIDGFTHDFIDWIPDHLLPYIIQKGPVRHISKAKHLARRLKSSFGKEKLSAREALNIFSGLDLADIEEMSQDEIIQVLPQLRDMDLPLYIGRKIVRKIERRMLWKTGSKCHTAFQQMGKLAKYIRPRQLYADGYIPINDTRDFTEDCQLTDIHLTKSQAYAVMDNVVKHVRENSESGLLNARILRQIGRFVTGIAAKDIESLPLDTELLSIVEVLSDYEEELTSAQTDAITKKILEYLDISNRNQITEASDITMAQIGRFLQYLNPEFELPKFPKSLRPSISREIGKSSLLKVSSGKRKALLSFALRSSEAGDETTVDVLQRGNVENNDIEDLGSLKCGLTVNIVNKLSQEAIDKNMEDFQKCPFTDEVFEALGKRAVDLNVNRLTTREGLGPMASTLQFLSDNDSKYINQKKMSSMASFVVNSMNQLDKSFDRIEKNGFVAERNSLTKEMHKARREKFVRTLHEIMVDDRNEDGCPIMLALNTGLPEYKTSTYTGIEKCLESVGNLPNWETADARKVLTKILENDGGELSPVSIASMSPDMIVDAGGLLKGLTDNEMTHVNITDIETLAAVGAHDFNRRQLSWGFKNWNLKAYKFTDIPLSEDELASMQNFACGMTVSELNRRFLAATALHSLDVLGKLKCFDVEQMKALVKRVRQTMPNTPIRQWQRFIISEMGHLIAGLNKEHFQQLTKDHIEVIEPEVITSLPPDKLKDFTIEQLEQFSTGQGASVTSMQRSYMSEDQVAALGKSIFNGAGQNSFGSFTIVMILLSLLRQMVVYL